jgi:hypothetical protein
MTVAVGQLLDQLGLSLQTETWTVAATHPGRNFDVRTRTAARAMPIENVRSRQPARIPVNADHRPDAYLGRVVHLERPDRGRHLWAVAQLQGELPAESGPLWFSVETESAWAPRSATRDDIEITGVGIVEKTAVTCTSPIRFLPGRLDSHSDRMRWQLPQHLQTIIEHAVEVLDDRRHNRPIQVRGLMSLEQQEAAWAAAATLDYYRANPHLTPRHQPTGQIEHSQHVGKVLKVE